MRTALYFPWWAVLWLLLSGQCFGDLSTCIEATCRVTATTSFEQSVGTGCAFARTGDRLWIWTCEHVVRGSNQVQCEFWHRGHQSRPIPGTVTLCSSRVDAAVIAIELRYFADGPIPPTIPLAAPDEMPVPGTTLCSVGCANGAWATAWKGHLAKISRADLYCWPSPAGGRSGSAVFDAAGEKIIGILYGRGKSDGICVVTHVSALYREFDIPVTSRTQCPGGFCRPPRNWRPAPTPREPGGQNGSGKGPWDSLPPQPEPLSPGNFEVPPLPDTALGDELDRANGTLERIASDTGAIRQQTKPAAEPKPEETADTLSLPLAILMGLLALGAAAAVFYSNQGA